MSREIKFRGKSVKTGEWVYGFYYEVPAPLKCIGKQDDPECNIVFENTNSCPDWGMPRDVVRDIVENETVGQYTGLKDKNGKEIYEGDIVKEYCGEDKDEYFCTSKVVWIEDDCVGWALEGVKDYDVGISNSADINDLKECEVIGNIYENPELLEEKQ